MICVPRMRASAGGAIIAPDEYVLGISAAEAAQRLVEAFGSRGRQ